MSSAPVAVEFSPAAADAPGVATTPARAQELATDVQQKEVAIEPASAAEPSAKAIMGKIHQLQTDDQQQAPQQAEPAPAETPSNERVPDAAQLPATEGQPQEASQPADVHTPVLESTPAAPSQSTKTSATRKVVHRPRPGGPGPWRQSLHQDYKLPNYNYLNVRHLIRIDLKPTFVDGKVPDLRTLPYHFTPERDVSMMQKDLNRFAMLLKKARAAKNGR